MVLCVPKTLCIAASDTEESLEFIQSAMADAADVKPVRFSALGTGHQACLSTVWSSQAETALDFMVERDCRGIPITVYTKPPQDSPDSVRLTSLKARTRAVIRP